MTGRYLKNQLTHVASERASEPRERSARATRRARERVGESEGRSPSDRTMTKRTTALIAALVAAGIHTSAAQQSRAQADKLMAAAQHQAAVQGDLRAAIAQYRNIAETFKGDHAVAATALLRMAEAHERLGDGQAKGVYEQILRDHAGQSEAATTARARLAQDRSPEQNTRGGATNYRSVWSGPEVATEGSISADGRYVSYPAWASGDLAIHDLVTGTSRLLTNSGNAKGYDVGYAQASSLSRDGKQIAFTWFRNDTKRYVLRLMTVTPTGFPTPKTLLDSEEFGYFVPRDWTPDAKSFAVQITRKDGTLQIGLVSAPDGTLRVLKTTAWQGPQGLFISPDGRFLAYDMPSDEPQAPRDVYVMNLQTLRETRVVAHPKADHVMGWTPDGSRLLFASDRSGRLALWAARLTDGAGKGDEELVHAQEISPASLGVAAGKLFVYAQTGVQDVQTARIDLKSGRLESPPTSAVQTMVGTNLAPDWSPDGRHLAYLSRRGSGDMTSQVLVVRSMQGSEPPRELGGAMRYPGNPRWMPDGRALIVSGRDDRARPGVHRVDAVTGEVTPLSPPNPGSCAQIPQRSPDARKIYYFTRGCAIDGAPYVEFDLSSGTERTVFSGVGPLRPDLSRDGKLLAGVTNMGILVIVEVATGQQRELYRPPAGATLQWPSVLWTPDQTAVIVSADEKNASRVLLVPIDGAPPRTLDLPKGAGGIRLHPDGTQIAFSVGQVANELWALENFMK